MKHIVSRKTVAVRPHRTSHGARTNRDWRKIHGCGPVSWQICRYRFDIPPFYCQGEIDRTDWTFSTISYSRDYGNTLAPRKKLSLKQDAGNAYVLYRGFSRHGNRSHDGALRKTDSRSTFYAYALKVTYQHCLKFGKIRAIKDPFGKFHRRTVASCPRTGLCIFDQS